MYIVSKTITVRKRTPLSPHCLFCSNSCLPLSLKINDLHLEESRKVPPPPLWVSGLSSESPGCVLGVPYFCVELSKWAKRGRVSLRELAPPASLPFSSGGLQPLGGNDLIHVGPQHPDPLWEHPRASFCGPGHSAPAAVRLFHFLPFLTLVLTLLR